MNAIRKIGAWFWNSKERMVLAVMVVVLCYRVYQVVRPPVTDGFKKDYRSPSPEMEEQIIPKPPPIPLSPPTENWSLIWRRSPWQWDPRTNVREQNEEAEQSINLELLDIKEVTPGVYRVRIRSAANRTGWYDEGESFESYDIISIDPDTDSCVIFAEEISRNIELTIE